MANRTRRYETGKMLMDMGKYFATITGIGSLVNELADWRISVLGWVMAMISWIVGFWTIPKDKEDKL